MIYDFDYDSLVRLMLALEKPLPKVLPATPLKTDAEKDKIQFYQLPKDPYGFFCPKVTRVIFNGNSTVVMFDDGTKSVVVKEPNDSYDKTTAVTYAIVKRLLGTAVNAKTNAVNSAYINIIHDLVKAGYDQENEDAKNAEKKKAAIAKHEAEQKILQEKAFKRRVRNRVRELEVEEAARDVLNGINTLDKVKPANLNKKQVLNESNEMSAADFFNLYDEPTTVKANTPPKGTELRSGLMQVDPKDAWKLYRRPDKPFSKFTEQEKKEYWRYHNAKRRASK